EAGDHALGEDAVRALGEILQLHFVQAILDVLLLPPRFFWRSSVAVFAWGRRLTDVAWARRGAASVRASGAARPVVRLVLFGFLCGFGLYAVEQRGRVVFLLVVLCAQLAARGRRGLSSVGLGARLASVGWLGVCLVGLGLLLGFCLVSLGLLFRFGLLFGLLLGVEVRLVAEHLLLGRDRAVQRGAVLGIPRVNVGEHLGEIRLLDRELHLGVFEIRGAQVSTHVADVVDLEPTAAAVG